MRYLGLDLGTTTLGIAISDKTNTLVSPYKLISFKKEEYASIIDELLKVISENNITDVVLGLPKNMDNSLGFASERSINFQKLLEDEGINVHLQDERLTTVEAINILKNNGMKNIKQHKKTDILSAVLILETYLKRKDNEK